MHTHSDYATALSCLKEPFILPIHQSSMRFVERVAYYQAYDVPDVIEEGKKLGQGLKDKDILIMGQHGQFFTIVTHSLLPSFSVYIFVCECFNSILFIYLAGILVVAPTVHQAFDDLYYLERACKIQLLAMMAVRGNKAKLSLLSDKDLYRTVSSSYTNEMIDTYSKRHFYSYWDMYLRNEPEVFS